jgi:dihydroorotase
MKESRAVANMDTEYDLLIRNGTLLDPGIDINQKADIAAKGDKIAFIGRNSDSVKARQILDASDRLITPGLIDLHVHIFWGVSHYGIEVDPNCLDKGVTTAVDAGSAGAWTFPALRRYIIDVSATRLFAFLNISSTGMISPEVGELEDIRHANIQKAIDTCEKNRDVILGVKVRLSKDLAGRNDIEALKRARDASDALGLPIMVHPPNAYSPIDEILSIMREGDILTHCYHGHAQGILDEAGKVRASVRKAVDRGILMDVGHGQGSFTFEVATKALEQELMPNTISSDLHFYNVNGPVYDLATTVSKFVYLGIPLESALEMCITRPAQFLRMQDEIGILKVGAHADIAVFEFAEGRFKFVDCEGQMRIGSKCLIPKGVVRSGRLVKSEKDRLICSRSI